MSVWLKSGSCEVKCGFSRRVSFLGWGMFSLSVILDWKLVFYAFFIRNNKNNFWIEEVEKASFSSWRLWDIKSWMLHCVKNICDSLVIAHNQSLLHFKIQIQKNISISHEVQSLHHTCTGDWAVCVSHWSHSTGFIRCWQPVSAGRYSPAAVEKAPAGEVMLEACWPLGLWMCCSPMHRPSETLCPPQPARLTHYKAAVTVKQCVTALVSPMVSAVPRPSDPAGLTLEGSTSHWEEPWLQVDMQPKAPKATSGSRRLFCCSDQRTRKCWLNRWEHGHSVWAWAESLESQFQCNSCGFISH